jgi:hypothetical protein
MSILVLIDRLYLKVLMGILHLDPTPSVPGD